MNSDAEADTDPTRLTQDLPRIMEALRLAVRDALQHHKQAGNPVAVWRDGQVVWIAAADIPVDDDPSG